MVRKLAMIATFAVTAISGPALAETWVTFWEEYKLDFDSIRTDAQGITRYRTRAFPTADHDMGAVKDRAADCAHRVLYLVANGDWVALDLPTHEGELSPMTKAQLDMVCAEFAGRR